MPEKQTVEWKSSWRDEYLKWVCGFANAQGGVLEIGKDDRGAVVGLTDSKRLLEDIPNKINSSMAIMADVDLREEGGLEYLVITVEAYPYPISYHGKYYYRSGATNRELTGNALDEFILKKQGRTWDGVPVPQVRVEDLDMVAFREFRRRAMSSLRLTEADVAVSDAELLRSLRLTDGDYLKRAAVLLFHEQPEQYVIGAYVKIGYFETGADLMYMDEVHGSLITMADKVVDILYSKYFKGLISYDRLQRIETFPVPIAACREAVLNAIVHRDYGTGVPIQIKVFPDEVIIYNVGQLPEHWTVADLLARHSSMPHNPNIANAFFRSGQIETWGRGIEKIEEACKAGGHPAPEFVATGTEIRVRFTTPITEVDFGDRFGEDIGDVRLNASQVNILRLMSADPRITTQVISERVGTTKRQVEVNIAKLKALGLVERQGSARNGTWQVK
ncbi:MAG: putative DNA binding domain-containing protein [Propionibacteriaceae bacterium]|nr:putative DNA binding domain-containing protein [Propionibacteriaceae bacterium]